MNTNPSPRGTEKLTGRTRLVTAASIIAVGVAGAVALGANLGILHSPASGQVGNVTANELAPPTSQVADVLVPGSILTPTIEGVDGSIEEFQVDVAGTVSVTKLNSGVHLEKVAPASGWRWTLTQTDPSSLQVNFKNGARTFEFKAAASSDGTIAAHVSEPITEGSTKSGDADQKTKDHDDHNDDRKGKDHGDHKSGDHDHDYKGADDDD